MNIKQLYKKEQLLLNRLILMYDEKTTETIINKIKILNENIKMLEAQSNER